MLMIHVIFMLEFLEKIKIHKLKKSFQEMHLCIESVFYILIYSDF